MERAKWPVILALAVFSVLACSWAASVAWLSILGFEPTGHAIAGSMAAMLSVGFAVFGRRT